MDMDKSESPESPGDRTRPRHIWDGGAWLFLGGGENTGDWGQVLFVRSLLGGQAYLESLLVEMCFWVSQLRVPPVPGGRFTGMFPCRMTPFLLRDS